MRTSRNELARFGLALAIPFLAVWVSLSYNNGWDANYPLAAIFAAITSLLLFIASNQRYFLFIVAFSSVCFSMAASSSVLNAGHMIKDAASWGLLVGLVCELAVQWWGRLDVFRTKASRSKF